MGKTLLIIKPHVFIDAESAPGLDAKKVEDEIINIVLFAGLKSIGSAEFMFDEAMIRQFYKVHADKPWFETDLIRNMLQGKAKAFILEGSDAIAAVRALIGDTNPIKAALGTIRAKYGRLERGPNNAVHASDSPRAFKLEIKVLRDNGVTI